MIVLGSSLEMLPTDKDSMTTSAKAMMPPPPPSSPLPLFSSSRYGDARFADGGGGDGDVAHVAKVGSY